MTHITIPKSLQHNDAKQLVAVPKKEYRAFLAWQKKEKSQKQFTPTREDTRTLEEARENRKKGNYTEFSELRHAVETRSR